MNDPIVEAHRRKQAVIRTAVEEVTKKLADDGKIIEAGWVGMRMMALPKDAPAIQIEEMRNAFFAGAQHLFGSIISMLGPEAEPNDTDLRRMDLIDAELRQFIKQYEQRHRVAGTA